MMLITGCTILRDAKGNPGKRIDHYREVSEAELDAHCRRLLAIADKLHTAEKRESAGGCGKGA